MHISLLENLKQARLPSQINTKLDKNAVNRLANVNQDSDRLSKLSGAIKTQGTI